MAKNIKNCLRDQKKPEKNKGAVYSQLNMNNDQKSAGTVAQHFTMKTKTKILNGVTSTLLHNNVGNYLTVMFLQINKSFKANIFTDL